ncbi:MAG: YchJ family protein [gamma proteobacterium symbiont of Bathyaustriella thionipta]|nr:YchJ family protein [gamma proteobacterium symbiont of Bathyaustriella thionipta]
MTNICPCGSGKPYASCCEPLHTGAAQAETAEALMRARYSAFEKGAYDFLHNSLHPEHRADHDLDATRRWAQKSTWVKLEVESVEQGAADDDQGTVVFKACFRDKKGVQVHHEAGQFQRYEGAWYYVDGKLVAAATVRHEAGKVGRNDPCPCGSGKKYKKCCGR